MWNQIASVWMVGLLPAMFVTAGLHAEGQISGRSCMARIILWPIFLVLHFVKSVAKAFEETL